MAEETFDHIKLRAAALGIVSVWMTVEDVQREFSAAREKAGEKPSHVPIQVVQQLLAQLVEQGSVAERKEPGKPVAYRLNRQALIARRAKVLAHLAFQTDGSELEPKLLDRTGATELDVDELVGQGHITRKKSEVGSLIMLASKVSVEIVQRGTEAVIGATIPVDADDRAIGEDFAIKAVKKAEAAEDRAKKAELSFGRLRAWLADKGIVDIDGIIEPPPPKRQRDVFEHIETRKIDDAEKGRILVEIMKLEETKSLVTLRFDGHKSQAKADIEKIDGEIAALKSAAQSSERVITVTAFKDLDWKANAVVIRALDDGRELSRSPIPKGVQKPIPGAETNAATPVVAGATPIITIAAEPAAPAGDPRPVFEDVAAAIFTTLKGGGLTLEDLAKRIAEGYQNTPDGLEGFLKMQCHQLLKGKQLARDKKTGVISIVEQEQPATIPEGTQQAETDEPGPLADAETRTRARSKKKAGEDEVRP